MVMDIWHALAGGQSATFEIRWMKPPMDESTTEQEEDVEDCLWTLTACVPIKSEDGTVTGIFGCNTDISAQKEATRTALLRMKAERRLAGFTETAPVGLYHLNPDLEIEYCNDQWFEITGHPRVPMNEINWRLIIFEEDLEGIYWEMETTRRNKKPHTFSFRLKKLWTGPDGISTPTWLLATATAHSDAEAHVVSIMGTMTDISQLKWAENIQRNRVEEALESKRQQENFIDMTRYVTFTSNCMCDKR